MPAPRRVLDDHPLAKDRGQAFGDDPGDDVGRPGGAERHDDGDGLRERLRTRLREDGQSDRGAGQQTVSSDGSCCVLLMTEFSDGDLMGGRDAAVNDGSNQKVITHCRRLRA